MPKSGTNIHPGEQNTQIYDLFNKVTKNLNCTYIQIPSGVASGFFDDKTEELKAVGIRTGNGIQGIRARALLDNGNVTVSSIERYETLSIFGADTNGIVYNKEPDTIVKMDDATKEAETAFILEHAAKISKQREQRS